MRSLLAVRHASDLTGKFVNPATQELAAILFLHEPYQSFILKFTLSLALPQEGRNRQIAQKYAGKKKQTKTTTKKTTTISYNKEKCKTSNIAKF